jgi:hypothetical protein
METKGDNIYVNIKELPNLDQISADDLLIVETTNGTTTIPFGDFIIGGENTTFYAQVQNNTTNIASLSTSVLELSSSTSAALTAANLTLIETTSASLYSTTQATSASLYSTIQSTTAANITNLTTFSAAALLPFAWVCYENSGTVLSNNVSLVTVTPSGTPSGQIQTVQLTFTKDIGTTSYITQITHRNTVGLSPLISSLTRATNTVTFVVSAARDISGAGFGFDVTCSV